MDRATELVIIRRAYAKQIVAAARVNNPRVEEAFAAFEKLGWSGMMVDFFDHDDQEHVEFAESILQAAARHHIVTVVGTRPQLIKAAAEAVPGAASA
jgi:DNA helicase IV